ncbi:MAG: KH domain-containing protein [Nanoarchaeota archaeon]
MFLEKETIKKISRDRKKLEKKLKVRIEIKGQDVECIGDEIDVYISERVFEALEKGFFVNKALLLTDEDYVLEEIPIKNISKKNINSIKARIIGKQGKTLKTLCELSECHISLYNNIVSVIGLSENIKDTLTALKSLIRGSKQSNVYSYLQKVKEKPYIEDLGIKQE